MAVAHTLKVAPFRVDPSKLGYFRFGAIGGDRVVLTTDAGGWHVLGRDDFRALVEGRLGDDHPERPELERKAFLRRPGDVAALAEGVRDRTRFLGVGPHLHVVVTTLRCNQSCSYCHASRAPMDRVDTDMSMETARRVLQHALKSPSPEVVIEYQGGEPTTNMDVIKFMVEESRRIAPPDKRVLHSLVTNMTAMTEEKANWLVDNEVLVCTSIDGPRDLHDANRRWTGGSAFDEVIRWKRYFDDRHVALGRDPDLWHVDALTTVTRATLDRWEEVVDLYVALGLRTLHFRPLNPYGFAAKTWSHIGYSMDEFLAVYERVLDRMLELNRQGVGIGEGTAATFLTKLLTPFDPNYVDIRSPCGAGTGQVAWGHDGRVFPCDEARMLAAGGDPTFDLGPVEQVGVAEVLAHPTVRAMGLASVLDALPACADCWAKPFCGVCPVHTWKTEHDLFGQRPRSPMCLRFLRTLEMLVRRLDEDADGTNARTFHRWTLRRPVSAESPCP